MIQTTITACARCKAALSVRPDRPARCANCGYVNNALADRDADIAARYDPAATPKLPFPRRRKAFCMVELLVAIAVVAILVAITLPAMGRARGHAYDARCLANCRSAATAWAAYWHDRGEPPQTWEDLGIEPLGCPAARRWMSGADGVFALADLEWTNLGVPAPANRAIVESRPPWEFEVCRDLANWHGPPWYGNAGFLDGHAGRMGTR